MRTLEDELLMMALISTTKRKTLTEIGFDKFVNLVADTLHEAKIDAIGNVFNDIQVNVLKLPAHLQIFSAKHDVRIKDVEMPWVLEVIGYALESKRDAEISVMQLPYANPVKREEFVMQAAKAFYESKDSAFVKSDIRNVESYLQDIALKQGYLIKLSQLNEAAHDVLAEINLMKKWIVGFEEKRKLKMH